MKNIFTILFLITITKTFSQANVLPAPAQSGVVQLAHGTVHIGNGEVIEDGMVAFSDGKIINVGKYAPLADGKMIDCTGKHIYPGLILSSSNIGLSEIGAIRSEQDTHELGDLNPDVRSLVAYNTDSKIINTVRSNGILLANIVPDGGVITGSSSVMQLDGWNWEDAV